MNEASEQPSSDREQLGGSGGKTVRTESGRTILQDQRLTMSAIRQGWIKGTRWPTEATVDDFQGTLSTRKLTVKERATLTALRGFDSVDERIQQIAVKSAVAMEAQNQADEHVALRVGQPTGGVTFNLGLSISTTTAEQLRNDPGYVRFISQTVAADQSTDLARHVRGNGEPGAMAISKAPPGGEPRDHGPADRGNGDGHPDR